MTTISRNATALSWIRFFFISILITYVRKALIDNKHHWFSCWLDTTSDKPNVNKWTNRTNVLWRMLLSFSLVVVVADRLSIEGLCYLFAFLSFLSIRHNTVHSPYSALSCFQITHVSQSLARSRGRYIWCLFEFSGWPKLYHCNCCDVRHIMLYPTAIYLVYTTLNGRWRSGSLILL